ncbi:hypothetical protein [Clostera anachoreta granulovirus]|uniref:Uncharacterized protein n=1 Tax=Clostera anachoreta granulovirus TaxID=283675 RepID=F4ZKY9_9BBAC|nr:hypothetical protein ClanGV_gp112 [Clostera anachoreta granulovirus]AEB00400.1 hypothetical protein [Clostera anachoreta granulovirus]
MVHSQIANPSTRLDVHILQSLYGVKHNHLMSHASQVFFILICSDHTCKLTRVQAQIIKHQSVVVYYGRC